MLAHGVNVDDADARGAGQVELAARVLDGEAGDARAERVRVPARAQPRVRAPDGLGDAALQREAHPLGQLLGPRRVGKPWRRGVDDRDERVGKFEPPCGVAGDKWTAAIQLFEQQTIRKSKAFSTLGY